MFLTKKISNLDELSSIKLAHLLAKNISNGVIFLEGNLGAGKTFLVRSWLKCLGFKAAVKSPTFTLVEPYKIGEIEIYHCDLYRLSCAEELDFIGGRDFLHSSNLCFIEWAQNGAGFLPNADLIIKIAIARNLRNYIICANSDYGQQLLLKIDLCLDCNF